MQQTIAACRTSVSIVPFGETAVTLAFGQGIDPELHRQVKAVSHYLDNNPFPGLVEYVAAFASVTVFYDPVRLDGDTVAARLQAIVSKLEQEPPGTPRVVEIPVCYGGEFGPDLEFVAQHNSLTADAVIALHSGGQYLVYMLGFAPGFPYLGGMPEQIAAPRRESPRPAIPAGSVGIAGRQTGVYPITTPGGWQLIGRTPLDLFCPAADPPTLLCAGDMIRFRPINRQEYRDLKGGGQ